MIQKTPGMTLVELLIALAIMMAVLVTAGSFLISSQRTQAATVDLSSRLDARIFVSNLLNYDFRIVCYESDDSCGVDASEDKVTIFYKEDRFGEEGIKRVTWTVVGDTLMRSEASADTTSDADILNRTPVLKNVEAFAVTYQPALAQLIEFKITRTNDPNPILVNVAILNQVSSTSLRGGN